MNRDQLSGYTSSELNVHSFFCPLVMTLASTQSFAYLARTGDFWLPTNAAIGVNEEYIILFELIYESNKDVYKD